MATHSPLPLAALALVVLLGLSSCSGSSFQQPTPTPLPTSSLPGLVTVQPGLCRAAQLEMLRVDEPQGDLLAWSPDGQQLAYVAPSSGSTWLVGTLMLVSAPAFDAPQKLADRVAGDLAWSPAGRTLAYLQLRRADDLYSVSVVTLPDGASLDLFPAAAARLDAWSSQKAVLGWESEDRLRVLVSCGLDCVQTVEANLATGSLTNVGEPAQRPWDWWNYTLNQPVELPLAYQGFMQQPNWAPDGRRLVYLDARSDAWVVSLDEGTQFPLDTGGYLAVSETDWSANGRYLAAHADDWLFIFSADCP